MHDLSDRALKERIIGAVVLVVVAVLVVPVFLDGPSDDEEMVSQAVTLPGQNDQERKQQTIVLERDREQPVPVSTAPTATPVPDQAAPAERKQDSPPAEEPKPAAQPPTSSEPAAEPAVAKAGDASATGMWAVQLGSFSSQENAERLAASLREQGYAAFISRLESGGRELHRVRVGPQKDRESAEAIAAQLAKSGHSGQVVPHP